MAITYYVVVPFGRNDDGDLVPLEPIEAQHVTGARQKARALAAKHGGAIAFSRTIEPATGEATDAVILLKEGEVDEGMLGCRAGIGPHICARGTAAPAQQRYAGVGAPQTAGPPNSPQLGDTVPVTVQFK